MLPSLLTSTDRESETPAVPRAKSQVEKQASARYQALANEVSTALYTCAASGVIEYYNNRATELWGRKPAIGDTDERFCGSSVLYRPDGSHLPHEQCPMADVLSGMVSGVFDAEVHIQRPDGSRVIVIVNIAPLIDDNGDIVGAINSFYDVTETKNREATPA